jgi:multidrug resistance efflux pump
VVAILMAWRVGPFAGNMESTENAYVRGQVTIVSPQVSGYVVEVPVKDFATVKAGDVLARIDDRIYRQRVEQARANLASTRASLADNPQKAASGAATLRSQQAGIDAARAQLTRAQADNSRIEELARQGFVANRERDSPRARHCVRRRPICARRGGADDRRGRDPQRRGWARRAAGRSRGCRGGAAPRRDRPRQYRDPRAGGG